MKPLGEIVTIHKGRKAAEVCEKTRPGAQRYLQIDDLRPDATVKYAVDANGVVATERDILIAWDGANAGTTSYGLNGYAGSTLAVLRIKDAGVYTPFLGRFLQNKFTYLHERCTGATIPHVERTSLEELEVPLPLLSEQKRTAALLDKADRLRRSRRYVQELSDSFLQSVFLEMFGDPVSNPYGWDVRLLEDLTAVIDYGITASAKADPVGPRFLRITDIQDGQVNWATVPYCQCLEKERRQAALKRGDIVFARTGATTGKSFHITGCPSDAVFASYLIRIRPNAYINPYFLAEFFQTQSYWSQIAESASGSAQPGVNSTKLALLKVIVPPLEKQEKFIAVVRRVERLRAQQREADRQAEHLFQTLLHHAFSN